MSLVASHQRSTLSSQPRSILLAPPCSPHARCAAWHDRRPSTPAGASHQQQHRHPDPCMVSRSGLKCHCSRCAFCAAEQQNADVASTCFRWFSRRSSRSDLVEAQSLDGLPRHLLLLQHGVLLHNNADRQRHRRTEVSAGRTHNDERSMVNC